MAVMIDAMVLIYAIGVELGKISPNHGHYRKALASHELIMESGTLAMAAISWYEVLRGMTPEQRDALARTGLHVDVRVIDVNVAKRAAELHMATRKPEEVCVKCLGAIKDPNKCSVCGNMRSKRSKVWRHSYGRNRGCGPRSANSLLVGQRRAHDACRSRRERSDQGTSPGSR